jgi:cytochrome c oxidase subunit 3
MMNKQILAVDGPPKVDGEGQAFPVGNGQLVLWWFLATVTMLFAAFASAFLVRRASGGWQPVQLPGLVWINVIVLAVSSGTMALARRHHARSRAWLWTTAALGVVFVAGQVEVWRQLGARGLLLPTSPYSSFFYILSGLHGLHLLGGLVLLGAALRRGRPATVECAATYWHFLGGLWVGVLAFITWV